MKYKKTTPIQNPDKSLLIQERGLKYRLLLVVQVLYHVAPYTGAWIEIRFPYRLQASEEVAPYTGAWIEISKYGESCFIKSVAPYTGAWIEICLFTFFNPISSVAPYTGAWIEIKVLTSAPSPGISRSLYRSVD